MRGHAAVAAALLLSAQAGCFSVEYKDGQLVCDEGVARSCPSGFSCAAGLCRRDTGAAIPVRDGGSSIPSAAAAPDLAEPTPAPTTSADGGIDGCGAGDGLPDELRCTGLYADWSTKSLAPTVRAYTPGYQLWTDGAVKARWIYLPPGQTIDVTDPNEWVFPVGTKLWKEFSLPIGGAMRRVETRFLWKSDATTWQTTSYAWDENESRAVRSAAGVSPVPQTIGLMIPGSSTGSYPGYEIPSESQCSQCHQGRKDRVLGFDALLLSAPAAAGLTLATLKSEALLSSSNGGKDIAPGAVQLPGGAAERDALGLLHANCGVCCHNANRMGGPTAFKARVVIDATTFTTPATVAATPTYLSAVNVTSFFAPPELTGNAYRIRPTDPARSMVWFRAGQRDSNAAMPPLGSHAVPDDLRAKLQAWIELMTTANGYPAPLPP